jgi:hypothetical protein
MNAIPTNDPRYLQARKRVEDLKGFYVHLAIYVVVNAGLFLINWLTTDTWWVVWPLIGWGIGLAAHAVSVFIENGRLAQNWEARKMRQLLDEQDK